MTKAIIVTRDYLEKQNFLEKIIKLGKKYRVINENTYHDSDIDLYKDISEDEFYLLSFRFIKEDVFLNEPIDISGDNYYFYLIINYDDEIQTETNEFIKEILSMYSDFYVTDESYAEFYSLVDINSGNVPEWLKA